MVPGDPLVAIKLWLDSNIPKADDSYQGMNGGGLECITMSAAL